MNDSHKKDKIVCGMLAYPSGRFIVDEALSRAEFLQVCSSKGAKLIAALAAFEEALKDDAGIEFKRVLEVTAWST